MINAAILILAGTVFYNAHKDVTEIQQAYQLLAPLMGTVVAAKLFGIALFCSGQSSTITGTMAGQIIMEGFLNIRVRPWLRRLVTRLLAIVPAMVAIWLAGSHGTFQLLILSQVVLNLQLPFAIIPLIQFTSDRDRMGEFTNGPWLRLTGWACAVIVLGLNIWLALQTIGDWAKAAGPYGPLVWVVTMPVCLGLLGLLLWIATRPYHWKAAAPATLGLESATAEFVAVPHYKKILVPIDHSPLDRIAIGHAAALAAQHGARVYLLHVEEGVPSQIYGPEASTAEVQAGIDYVDRLVDSLGAAHVQVETAIRHGSQARREIIQYAREIRPDLLVMGAHGHGGLKDLVFGNTINPVRHALRIPILVVRDE